MRIEWKPEALKAGVDASIESQKYPRENITLAEYEEAQTHLRAALDAAVEAQGITDAFEAGVVSTFEQRAKDLEDVYAQGRTEAFEEVAKVLETWPSFDIWRSEAAAAIRSLKETNK